MSRSLTAIQNRLARAMEPDAWAARDERSASLSREEILRIEVSASHATSITDELSAEGVDVRQLDDRSLGDDLRTALAKVKGAVALLEGRQAEARGDLDRLLAEASDLADSIEEAIDDIVCTECGAYNNDGEGFDGLCGSCADRAEARRGTDAHPTVGDRVFMDIDEEVRIEIESVPTEQSHLAAGVWTIVDGNGDIHLVEDEGGRWETVTPDRCDVSDDPETTFAAVRDHGHWRGRILRSRTVLRDVPEVHSDSTLALVAALELHQQMQNA